MFRWIRQLREASKETRRFVYTLIVLFIVVLGTFFFAIARLQIPSQRSLPRQQEQRR